MSAVLDWHQRKARLYQRSVVPYLGGLPLPTDAEIQQAVRQMRDQGMWRRNFYIESNDTVRLAFAWLDAQSRTKRPQRPKNSVQPAVCAWAERYVSRTAIDCAAILHPEIAGRYPAFNISKGWTQPAGERLEPISEAGLHPNYRKGEKPGLCYRRREVGA